jgi:hypothetical protein
MYICSKYCYTVQLTVNSTGCFVFHNVLRDCKHCNKKTKGFTVMELFTVTGKLKKVSFYN